MVGNPAKAELTRLRGEVSAAREGIATALDAAAAKMGDGKTWTGPTAATNWASEVTGRKKSLPSWIDAVLQQIDAQLRSMPEKVTTTEARVFHNDQRTRGY
jgi:3-oxoacyl-ACP reductase-like protein